MQGSFSFLAPPPQSQSGTVRSTESPKAASSPRPVRGRIQPDRAVTEGTLAAQLAGLIGADEVVGPITTRPNDLALRLVEECATLAQGDGAALLRSARKALAHAAGAKKPYRNGRAFLWNWIAGDDADAQRTGTGRGVRALPRTSGPRAVDAEVEVDPGGDGVNPFRQIAG